MVKESNQNKVLEELFKRPTHNFHIRELARDTKLNPNTVITIIKSLEEENIIKKEAKRHIVEISLNLENSDTLWKKRLFNFLKIYSSGIIDFLVKKYSPQSISLIGSYSRGEDIEKSDIDFVIISDKKENYDLRKFEKILGRSIHLVILSNKMSDEFFNNLINGVVFYGYLKKEK